MTQAESGLKNLYVKLEAVNKKLQQLTYEEGEQSVYQTQLNTINNQLNDAKKEKFSLETQHILIKAIYGISKTQLEKIENLCTVALNDIIFDNTIKFKIKMVETKRGIDTYFYTETVNGESDVLASEAGGIKNILSVCLRLIFIEFCQPKVQGPVILDEVGANISEAYQKNFAEFLKQFSERNNRQIILISHIGALQEAAPKLITFTRKNGQTYIS